MPTNLALDDRLIHEAQQLGNHKTKRAAVTAALAEYVKRRRQRRILDLAGQVDYDERTNYKRLRHRKLR
jgi:Arc/MetJ family transcription regulator